MKKTLFFFCLIVSLFSIVGCRPSSPPSNLPKDAVDATEHGLSTGNGGVQNSKALQALIDFLSEDGGTIYIPAGEYVFAANGTQTLGSHCIKMRSNVSIVGEGASTVLKPTGDSWYGLDMFYFNDYLDTNTPAYLENCRFESFVIDAADTSCVYYTSAGKGFMFNLFRNCHWQKITVKNTDATGFGVDCPINSTITDCIAIGCGKAATEESTGASGFGIGFGYSENESLTITDCQASDNKKFGFFFEHQGRFNSEKYSAVPSDRFLVANCEAASNLFGFGGICTVNTVYENCYSRDSRRYGFVFRDSKHSGAIGCTSENDGKASFAILQNTADGNLAVKGISYLRCTGKNAPAGIRIVSENPSAFMGENSVENCIFAHTKYAVYTEGTMQSLTLSGNTADSDENSFGAEIKDFKNIGNSWNEADTDIKSGVSPLPTKCASITYRSPIRVLLVFKQCKSARSIPDKFL